MRSQWHQSRPESSEASSKGRPPRETSQNSSRRGSLQRILIQIPREAMLGWYGARSRLWSVPDLSALAFFFSFFSFGNVGICLDFSAGKNRQSMEVLGNTVVQG